MGSISDAFANGAIGWLSAIEIIAAIIKCWEALKVAGAHFDTLAIGTTNGVIAA